MSRLSPSGDSGFSIGVGGDLNGARLRVSEVHSKSPASGPISTILNSTISKGSVIGLHDEPMTGR